MTHRVLETDVATTKFRYLRDPIFVISCIAFLVNQYVIKANFSRAPHFFFWHFNDCLTIPCALPPLLWLQRKFGLRNHDLAPALGEIAFHLVLWSLFFKVFSPHFFHRGSSDIYDVVAFSAGALVAFLLWNSQYFTSQKRCDEAILG